MKLDTLLFRIVLLYILLIPFDGIRILPISFSNLFVILLTLGFAIKVIYSKKIINRSIFKLQKPYLIFMAFIIAISIVMELVNGTFSDKLIKVIFFIVINMLAFTIIPNLVNYNYKRISTLLYITFISTILAALSGYLEYAYFLFTGDFYYEPSLFKNNLYLIRLRGFYFDPNYFSVLLLMGLYLGLSIIKKRSYKVLIFIFFTFPIIFTFSRMAWICYLLSGSIYLFLNFKGTFKIVIIVLGIIILMYLPWLIEDLKNSRKESTDARIELLEIYWNKTLENPFLGFGINPLIDYKDAKEAETHNTYLQVLLYSGFVGFAMLFVPLFNNIFQIYESPKNIMTLSLRQFIIIFTPTFFISIFFLSYLMIKYFWIYIIINIIYLRVNNRLKG